MLKIALCDDDAVFLKELTGKIQELLRFEEKKRSHCIFRKSNSPHRFRCQRRSL